MPVVGVAEIPVAGFPVEDNPVLVSNLEKLLKVPRLPHQAIGVVDHDVPDSPAPGKLQKSIPSWPFPVTLPR